MEALRIFSMFCVLMVHTTFKACGAPGQEEITQAPWESLYFCTIASLSLIGVNCFVLISGYFGIKPRLKGILNFLFIVYFYRFGLYCSGILSAGGGISSKMLLKLLDPFSGEWFVGAYLGMYLLSPMMNAFMEKASREVLRKYVIVLLVLELMFGWLVPTWGMISNGYSTLSFCILYMIAGYVRRYVDVKKCRIMHCGLGYVGISVLVAVLYVMLMRYAPERYDSSISLHLYTYATPFIIVQSILLLVMFSKMNFSSRWVNFVAASTFSVYLIHCNDYVFPHYLEWARYVKETFWPWMWIVMDIAYVCAVFLACILVDQIRKLCWELVARRCMRTRLNARIY